jgi:hypothetical protein
LQEGHHIGPPQQSAFLLRHFVLQNAACRRIRRQPKARPLGVNQGQKLVEVGRD